MSRLYAALRAARRKQEGGEVEPVPDVPEAEPEAEPTVVQRRPAAPRRPASPGLYYGTPDGYGPPPPKGTPPSKRAALPPQPRYGGRNLSPDEQFAAQVLPALKAQPRSAGPLPKLQGQDLVTILDMLRRNQDKLRPDQVQKLRRVYGMEEGHNEKFSEPYIDPNAFENTHDMNQAIRTKPFYRFEQGAQEGGAQFERIPREPLPASDPQSPHSVNMQVADSWSRTGRAIGDAINDPRFSLAENIGAAAPALGFEVINDLTPWGFNPTASLPESTYEGILSHSLAVDRAQQIANEMEKDPNARGYAGPITAPSEPIVPRAVERITRGFRPDEGVERAAQIQRQMDRGEPYSVEGKAGANKAVRNNVIRTAPKTALELAHQMASEAAGGSLPLTGRPGAGTAAPFAGPLHSSVPGRTDRIRLDVKPGSYVMPADIVSIMGEGNTKAGFTALKAMFAPIDLTGGIKMPPGRGLGVPSAQAMAGALRNMRPPSPPQHAKAAQPKQESRGRRHAEGGAAEDGDGELVPIIAAGGEAVIPPELVAGKFGSLNHGHKTLDLVVKKLREQEIKRLRTAPAPKK